MRNFSLVASSLLFLKLTLCFFILISIMNKYKQFRGIKLVVNNALKNLNNFYIFVVICILYLNFIVLSVLI